MKLLITPAEVAADCFNGDANLRDEFIKDSAILTAQRKYIYPLLGKSLWNALENKKYDALADGYVKPALALYVKAVVLPAVYSQAGIMGVVQYAGRNFTGAAAGSFADLLKSIRNEADTMMRICMEHIETRAADYPEYDPRENAGKKFSVQGGVVL